MTHSIDDPEFLRLLKGGDKDALSKVVRTCLPQVLRAARGAGLSASQAEEAAQATFAVFIGSIARFEGRSQVSTWLLGILYRKVAEARRELSRRREVEDIEQVLEDRFDASGRWSHPPEAIDAGLLREEFNSGLQECLDALGTKQRMAFTLRDVEGISSEEVRKILEVTDTNLGVLLFRSRNNLRECLEKKGLN